VARGHDGPVKWQFVGPLSVGLALRRAGADPNVAFPMAARVVRSHLTALSSAVADALPASPQLVVLDEPLLDGLMAHDFPIAPEEAIDLLSSAMAVVEHRATVGLHSCGDVDLATVMSSGPKVLSLPVSPTLVPLAGYLARFLGDGGWIAWGAIATEGPIGTSPTRSAARLAALWVELARRGCDLEQLRAQSLITPQCGLGGHCTSVAERVCETLRAVASTVVPW
jgi:methionine synthase II (cobalamin-independent)